MAFRPGRRATGLMLGGLLLFCGLGTWQVHRLHWRRAWIAERTARLALPPEPIADAIAAPDAAAGRRARARGTYDPAASIVVLRAARRGETQVRVLTPLRLEGAGPDAPAVLVDRGWIPNGLEDRFLDEPAPEGPTEVTGMVVPLALGGAAPGGAPRRPTWMRFDPATAGPILQAQLSYRLAPVMLQREDDGTGAPPVGGIEPPSSPVDHRAYAITWFSIAGAVVLAWAEHGRQRGRREEPALH